jgi:tetratricopeptide (TPR) repeat protein
VSIGSRTLTLTLATMALHTAAQAAAERSLSELAKDYRAGDREPAVDAVTLMARETVEREVDRLVAYLARIGLTGNAERQSAVALLTEAALVDFQDRDFRRGRWEVQAAARLVRSGPPATRGSPFERCFFLVGGIALQLSGALEPAHDLLQQGLDVASDDAELHTAAGAVVETVAALRQYDPSPDSDRRRMQPGGYANEDGGSGALAGASLSRAVEHYESALRLDPELTEARLRLGRVRLLQGRWEQALRELDRVAVRASDPGRRYLARLFQGRALEALDDLQGAATAYGAAAELVPQAQTAQLALGRVLDGLGDIGAAQAAFEAAVTGPGPEDPWWDYQSGQPGRLQGLSEELRRLAR